MLKLEKTIQDKIQYNFDIVKALKKLMANLIYENKYFFCFNKPQGLCVQDGTKTTISIDRILKANEISSNIVHRLDKNTTGIIIIAKSSLIAAKISKLFNTNRINKLYLGLVNKCPNVNKGYIITINNNKKIQTNYRIIKKFNKNLSLVAFHTMSGTKHQIRKHAENIGCPIYGDNRYGCFGRNKTYLHASQIKFNLSNQKYFFKAELPKTFQNLINTLVT